MYNRQQHSRQKRRNYILVNLLKELVWDLLISQRRLRQGYLLALLASGASIFIFLLKLEVELTTLEELDER